MDERKYSWHRGAGLQGSMLAEQMMGTNEGFSGSSEITIEEELVGAFNLIRLWLAWGDVFTTQEVLAEDNTSQVYEIGLEALIARSY